MILAKMTGGRYAEEMERLRAIVHLVLLDNFVKTMFMVSLHLKYISYPLNKSRQTVFSSFQIKYLTLYRGNSV